MKGCILVVGLFAGVALLLLTFACEVAVVVYVTKLILHNVKGILKFMLLWGVWSLFLSRLFQLGLFITLKLRW